MTLRHARNMTKRTPFMSYLAPDIILLIQLYYVITMKSNCDK